jgi:hypothetical protein
VGQPNAPHQVELVAVAFTAVAGLVDERADDMDAEAADATLFCLLLLQIRPAESKRIERQSIVDEAYPQAAPLPTERDGDNASRRMRPLTMRYGVGEQLIENDQKPRPLVIRQAALARELDGKGLKLSELRGLGT